ncbi:hypothetical protein BDQ12DRAFT_759970 [Crucibulum laeve]|uniref:Uncharacterized protein n=1 Tax=Crucibulum laeve TaxID=68775 RepID=A0A5C3LT90_9AGAR|nr:hypothetical protein BDQ12DRAFT_759970 [Crucibulum laeve]
MLTRNLNNVNDIEFFRSESDKTSIFKSLMTDLGHGKRIFKADKLSALLVSKQLKENRVPTKYFSCQTQSADNWDAEYLSAPPNTDSSDPKDNVIPFNGEVIEISVTATVYGTSVAVQEPYLYGRMPYTFVLGFEEVCRWGSRIAGKELEKKHQGYSYALRLVMKKKTDLIPIRLKPTPDATNLERYFFLLTRIADPSDPTCIHGELEDRVHAWLVKQGVIVEKKDYLVIDSNDPFM